MIRAFPIATAIGLSIIATLGGCTPADPAKQPASAPAEGQAGHVHEDVAITEADVDMPADYTAALPRIRSYRDTIRDRIAEGSPAAAHRALDELDIVLNKLPMLARDSDVPKEHWKEVNTSAQELRGLFNELHAAIDAGDKPDYAAVSEKIDSAIERLANIAGAQAP